MGCPGCVQGVTPEPVRTGKDSVPVCFMIAYHRRGLVESVYRYVGTCMRDDHKKMLDRAL
jgi:hypothetical protein